MCHYFATDATSKTWAYDRERKKNNSLSYLFYSNFWENETNLSHEISI